MSLSRGTGKVETLEEAFKRIASRISSDHFVQGVRQIVETGVNVKYDIKVSKRQSHGYTVKLQYTILDPERQLTSYVGLE